jgi:hypothetical protein
MYEKKKKKEKENEKKKKKKEIEKKKKKVQEEEEEEEEEQEEEEEEEQEEDEEEEEEEGEDVIKKKKKVKANYYVDVKGLDASSFKHSPKWVELANGEIVLGVDVRYGPQCMCVFCGKTFVGYGTLAHHSSDYSPRRQAIDSKTGKLLTKKVMKNGVRVTVPVMITNKDGEFFGTCMDVDSDNPTNNAKDDQPFKILTWLRNKANVLMSIVDYGNVTPVPAPVFAVSDPVFGIPILSPPTADTKSGIV